VFFGNVLRFAKINLYDDDDEIANRVPTEPSDD